MSDRRVTITVEAKDHATSVLRGVGGALGDIGKIAVGSALGQGLVGLAGSVAGFGKEALKTVAFNERLEQSLTTMLAKEIQAQGVLTKRVQIGTAVAGATQLTGKEAEKAGKLAEKAGTAAMRADDARRAAAERLQTAQVQLPAAIANVAKAEANLNAIKRSKNETDAQFAARQQSQIANLAVMKERIGDLQGVIAASGFTSATNNAISAAQKAAGAVKPVLDSTGKLVPVYKTITENTISLADAQRMAAAEAKTLSAWMEKVAIESPFEKEDIAKAFRMSMAYGFTKDEAKLLGQANVDLASATGMEGEALGRVTLALGQMRAKGRLMGQEMLQMTEAGVPFREILLESGKVAGLTADNFEKLQEKGLIPAKAAFEAYTEYVNKNFKGAGKAAAGTFSGLISSLSDLKKVVLQDFFGPIFRAGQPYLDRFVAVLQEPAVRANIAAIGQAIGTHLVGALGTASAIAEDVWAGFQDGGVPQAIINGASELVNLLGGDGDAVANGILAGFQAAGRAMVNLQGVWESVMDGFRKGGLAGAAGSLGFEIGTMLGFSPETVENIALVGESIVTAVGAVFEYLTGPEFAQLAGSVFNTLVTAGREVVTWAQTNWPVFKATVEQNVIPALQAAGVWLQENIPAAIATVTTVWNGTLMPAFQTAAAWITGTLIPTYLNLNSTFLTLRDGAIAKIIESTGFWVNLWQTSLQPTFVAVWSWIEANLLPTFDSINRFMAVVLFKATEILTNAWNTELSPALKEGHGWLAENILPALKDVSGFISTVIGPVINQFVSGALVNLRNGLKFIEDLLATIRSLLDGVTSRINAFQVPNFAGITAGAGGGATAQSFTPQSFSRQGFQQTVNVTVGRMDSGLDAYQAARATGTAVGRAAALRSGGRG